LRFTSASLVHDADNLQTPRRPGALSLPTKGYSVSPDIAIRAIALERIKAAKARGVAPGVILADAEYGADGGFRAGLSALDLTYAVGVQPTLSVWRPGEGPLPPKPWTGRGRPPSRIVRNSELSSRFAAEGFVGDQSAEAEASISGATPTVLK